MNAKEYLSQATWLDRMINSKLEQLEVLKSLAMKVTSCLSQERINTGNNRKSFMESTVVKIIDLENEINSDIDRLVDLKKDIQDTISRIENINYQILLEMRYLSGMNWEEIAQELNYNNRTVFKVHGRALKEFEQFRSNGQ